jgi:tetratricopeptide (TPR) repeat protein
MMTRRCKEMKHSLRCAVMVFVCVVVFCECVFGGAKEGAKEPTLSIELKGVSPTEAISEISRQSGVKVTLKGEPKVKAVTITLREVRLSEALSKICKMLQCGYCVVDNEYLVVPLPEPDELIKRIQATWGKLKRFGCVAVERRWDCRSWVEKKLEVSVSHPDGAFVKESTDDGEEIWLTDGKMTLHYTPRLQMAERWSENKFCDFGMTLCGPGNVALFGQAWESVLSEYKPTSVELIAVRGKPAFLLTLKCIKPRTVYELQYCNCGVYGLGFYCSPYMQITMKQPAFVQLAFDVDNLSLLHRAHSREDGRVIEAMTADTSQRVADGIPLYARYELRDAASTFVGEFTYKEFAELAGGLPKLKLPEDVLIVDSDTESVKELEDVLKRSDDAGVRFNLARSLWLKLGDVEQAMSHIQTAIKLNPKAPQLWLAYAQACASAFKFDESESAIREAIKLSPNRIDAYIAHLDALASMGRFDDALNVAMEAEKIATGKWLSLVLQRKASIQEALGRVEEAKKLYLQVLSSSVVDTDVAIASVERLLSLSCFDLDALYEEAQKQSSISQSPFLDLLLMRIAIERGTLDVARKHHALMVKKRPYDLSLRLNSANAFMRGGMLDDAESEYSAIVAMHPLSPQASVARQQLSAISILKKRYSDAFGWLLAVERWLYSYADMMSTISSFEDIFMRYFSADVLQAFAEASVDKGIHREIIYTLITDLHRLAGNNDVALTWARRGGARYPQNIWLKRAEIEALKEQRKWQDLDMVLKRECGKNRNQPYFHAERIWLYYRWRASLNLPKERTQFALVLRSERNAREEFASNFKDTPLTSLVYGLALANDIASFQSPPFDALAVLERALREKLPEGDTHDAIVVLRRALASCYGRVGKWVNARSQYKMLMRMLNDEFELAAVAREWFLGEVSRKRFADAIEHAYNSLNSFEPMAVKRALLSALTDLLVIPVDVPPLQRQLVEAEVNERLKVFQGWLDERDTDPIAHVMGGWVAVVRNDAKVAIPYFEASLKLASKVKWLAIRRDLLELIGDGFTAIGEHNRAVSAYEEALRLQPNRVSIYRKLIALMLQAGDGKNALSVAKRMLPYSNWASMDLFAYAQAVASSDDTSGALKWVERAIVTAQVNGDASMTDLGTFLLMKARLHEKLGETEEALKTYKQVALGAGIRRVVRRAAIEWLCNYYERRGDVEELSNWLKWLSWAAPELQKEIERKLNELKPQQIKP